jgi:heterodisulfide reductase subunit B
MSATALSTTFADRIRSETGENIFLCYQCNKCSAGCPLAQHFDLAPHQMMRAAQLGLEKLALESSTPWLCIGCETCTTRCPNGIDVARVMDFMAAESRARGIAAPVPAVGLFTEIFLKNLRRFGRSYELGLIMEMNLRSGEPLKDLSMGWAMMRKRKIKLLPEMAGRPAAAPPEPRKANQIGYYPGCSLHSVAGAYDTTVRAVAKTLDLELVEPQGWTCCGSSAAHRVEPGLAVELPLSNLALMDRAGMDAVAVPCSACFNRLKGAQQQAVRNPALKAEMEAKIGHTFERQIDVRTLVDVMVNRIGVQAIGARTVRPLASLKVACYYGCLMTRPPQVTEADEPEYPMVLDRLVAALGATPIDWAHKTSCCGASLSVTKTEVALGLSAKIIAAARSAGADVIAVACPLCHTNLDDRQPQMDLPDTADGSPRGVPVLYFTQLMALAFGLGAKTAALAKNMVDPRPALAGLCLLDQ